MAILIVYLSLICTWHDNCLMKCLPMIQRVSLLSQVSSEKPGASFELLVISMKSQKITTTRVFSLGTRTFLCNSALPIKVLSSKKIKIHYVVHI